MPEASHQLHGSSPRFPVPSQAVQSRLPSAQNSHSRSAMESSRTKRCALGKNAGEGALCIVATWLDGASASRNDTSRTRKTPLSATAPTWSLITTFSCFQNCQRGAMRTCWMSDSVGSCGGAFTWVTRSCVLAAGPEGWFAGFYSRSRCRHQNKSAPQVCGHGPR